MRLTPAWRARASFPARASQACLPTWPAGRGCCGWTASSPTSPPPRSPARRSPRSSRPASRQAVGQLEAAGLHPSWLHAGNSSTLDDAQLLPWLRAQTARLGARLLARTGLALFGHVLPLENTTAAAALSPHLQPVATWHARLLDVRELAAGDTLGYNATFTATAPMRVGLLNIGYADGLRRELSSTSATASSPGRPGGWTMLHGRRAPILGRISMNLTTIDLTDIPAAQVGDRATILGAGITAAQHAELAGTIPYEILCAMRGHRTLVP